jgi:hypothetical protein
VGVLDWFEQGIERAVHGAFAKAFRSEVVPVEIGSALQRECDARAAIVARDRTMVPNVYTVELSPADYQRLADYADALGEEFGNMLMQHARQQRYTFVGAVQVGFQQADDLDTGMIRVHSSASRTVPIKPTGVGHGSAGLTMVEQPQPPVSGPIAAQTPGSVGILQVDGRNYPINQQIMVIGRGTDADVILNDPGVSRRHAEIHVVAGRAQLVDLGSTNGSYVDGERVHTHYLQPGSVITIGRCRITFYAGQG